MDAQKRRQYIAQRLERSETPVSAALLARECAVSRQVIVGDVALLRASGVDIAATPRGYVLPSQTAGLIRTLATRHRGDQMEEELNAIVDQGCTVILKFLCLICRGIIINSFLIVISLKEADTFSASDINSRYNQHSIFS